MDVGGAASGYMTTYREKVEDDIAFKQLGGPSATTRLVFVMIKGLSLKLMTGCPTLDALAFATSYDHVELRTSDPMIPTMKDVGDSPDPQRSVRQ